VRRLIAVALLAGCASAGAPPGGPEDHAPPAIVTVTPDSGQTNANPKQVEFRFDEVVSDRPSGATALDQLFLVSPRRGNEAPNVSWHRSRITIKPRRGFLPNTAYRVTMLPGISDLRGNVRKEGASVLFSTGASFPALSILGRVFDWAAQRPVSGAYVEAVSSADTNVVYLAATDTSGQFDVGPLPAGQYLVRALIDQNSNRTLDRNEKWDTTTKTITDTRPVIELDAIERDSTPAAFSGRGQRHRARLVRQATGSGASTAAGARATAASRFLRAHCDASPMGSRVRPGQASRGLPATGAGRGLGAPGGHDSCSPSTGTASVSGGTDACYSSRSTAATQTEGTASGTGHRHLCFPEHSPGRGDHLPRYRTRPAKSGRPVERDPAYVLSPQAGGARHHAEDAARQHEEDAA
jgi:hypothetical protein